MTSFDIIPVDIFGSGQEGRLAVPPFGGFCKKAETNASVSSRAIMSEQCQTRTFRPYKVDDLLDCKFAVNRF